MNNISGEFHEALNSSSDKIIKIRNNSIILTFLGIFLITILSEISLLDFNGVFIGSLLLIIGVGLYFRINMDKLHNDTLITLNGLDFELYLDLKCEDLDLRTYRIDDISSDTYFVIGEYKLKIIRLVDDTEASYDQLNDFLSNFDINVEDYTLTIPKSVRFNNSEYKDILNTFISNDNINNSIKDKIHTLLQDKGNHLTEWIDNMQ